MICAASFPRPFKITRSGFYELVCLLCDTDRALSSSERFVSCEEAEAVGLFLKEHLTEVTMSKTYFSLVSNGTRDTESLKTFTDRSSSVCGTAAAFLIAIAAPTV